jgi:hypothetical protein
MEKNKTPSTLKTFFCIDYPALVKNEKEAIRTLGGETRVQQTFSSKKHNTKLLLNFTPDNIFSKVLCSNQFDDPTIKNDDEFKSNESNSSENTNDQQTKHKNEFPKETAQLNHKHNDLISMPCFLMSVKKQKNDATQYKQEIIGKIKTMYNFRKIADFQYLPMNSVSKSGDPNSQASESSPSTAASSTSFTFNAFYDNFLFNNIQNYDLELRKNTIPKLFILPPFFSRFDDPVSYSFKSETVKKVTSQKNDDEKVEASPKKSNVKQSEINESSSHELGTIHPENNNSPNETEASSEHPTELIRSMRQERSSQAILLTYKCTDVPMKCNDRLKLARNETVCECIAKLKELFEKRPCYLKSVLLCITKFSPSTLKEALPHCAYYFTTGPWRSCWVRFGYDPRKDPVAKMYQMIDYRLRYCAEPEQKIKSKPRPSYHKRKYIT